MDIQRELYINGQMVDIDENTVIGVDFQQFDISNPIKKRVKVSNNFSIPSTSHNITILGHPHDLQSIDITIYEQITCTYIVGGHALFTDNKIVINSIGKRIECILVDKSTLFDDFKAIKWNDFFAVFMEYLRDFKSLPVYPVSIYTTKSDANYINAIEPYINGKDYGVQFMQVFTSLNDYLPNVAGETYNSYYNNGLEQDSTLNGGRWAVFVKDIFKCIEYIFDCDFGTESNFTYNFWNQNHTNDILVSEQNIILQCSNFIDEDQFGQMAIYFEYVNTFFAEQDFTLTKTDKTLHDFVVNFLQEYAIIIEPNNENGKPTFKLYNYDDIKDYAPILNLTDGHFETTEFRPYFENHGQKSYIKYKTVPDGLTEFYGGKEIICENKNISPTGTISEIDSFFPSAKPTALSYIYIGQTEAMNNFLFFEIQNETWAYEIRSSNSLLYYRFVQNNLIYQTFKGIFSINKVLIHSVANEYNLLDEICEYPKFYKVKTWLTVDQLHRIRNYMLVYFQQLGGSFLINKINGVNIGMAKEPTEMELTFVTYRTPFEFVPSGVYIDFSDNYYTDNSGNFYFN